MIKIYPLLIIIFVSVLVLLYINSKYITQNINGLNTNSSSSFESSRKSFPPLREMYKLRNLKSAEDILHEYGQPDEPIQPAYFTSGIMAPDLYFYNASNGVQVGFEVSYNTSTIVKIYRGNQVLELPYNSIEYSIEDFAITPGQKWSSIILNGSFKSAFFETSDMAKEYMENRILKPSKIKEYYGFFLQDGRELYLLFDGNKPDSLLTEAFIYDYEDEEYNFLIK